MKGTVMAWVEAIATGKAFDEQLDAPRFRKAFVTLATTRTSWPAPADFLTVLPERDQLAIARESVKASPERAAAACAEIAKALRA
jgi:hypothetical protein